MKDITEAVQQSVTKRLLEKDIQKACVAWARKRGYWARKFSSPAQRSVPDYLFAHPRGMYVMRPLKFAVEFKAPGKTSTDAQIGEQEAMRLAGWYVFECDNVASFIRVVLAYEQEISA